MGLRGTGPAPGLKSGVQPASLLRTTFDGIGSYQTRDQISGRVFPHAVSLVCGGAEVADGVGGAEVAAAVVAVIEMPGLAGFDQLVAAAAGDLAGGDQRLELAAAGDVGVGVAGADSM
jgi:hypothetical protein